MGELRITFTLIVPDGAELVDVETTLQPAKPDNVDREAERGGPLASNVLRRIETAPPEYQELLQQFAERCQSELGCSVAVPQSKREDYANVYGPFGRKGRVASFMVRESTRLRGPRVEIYCDPGHAASHPPAEPDLHNGRPVQVKIYLGDPGALDAALVLVQIAIEERR